MPNDPQGMLPQHEAESPASSEESLPLPTAEPSLDPEVDLDGAGPVIASVEPPVSSLEGEDFDEDHEPPPAPKKECQKCGEGSHAFYACSLECFTGAGYKAEDFDAHVAEGKKREAEAKKGSASSNKKPKASPGIAFAKNTVRRRVVGSDVQSDRLYKIGEVASFPANHGLDEFLHDPESCECHICFAAVDADTAPVR